jgi:hypothetical protein
MLCQQHPDRIDEGIGLAKPRERKLLFELPMAILGERANDRGRIGDGVLWETLLAVALADHLS